MRFFQIGFNKCATTSFYWLFHRAGVRSLHSSGRYWRSRSHPAVKRRNVQRVIHQNIVDGRPALEGFDDFQAFFDMEYILGPEPIENYHQFATFARDYPDAKFMLNTRDKDAWLRSRARHKDGLYLDLARARFGTDTDGVLRIWSDDFDRHHDAVQDFFKTEQDRLLVFDIDKTPIKHLFRFVRPDIRLWRRHWAQRRVTDDVAKDRDWSDDHVGVAA